MVFFGRQRSGPGSRVRRVSEFISYDFLQS